MINKMLIGFIVNYTNACTRDQMLVIIIVNAIPAPKTISPDIYTKVQQKNQTSIFMNPTDANEIKQIIRFCTN